MTDRVTSWEKGRQLEEAKDRKYLLQNKLLTSTDFLSRSTRRKLMFLSRHKQHQTVKPSKQRRQLLLRNSRR